MNASALTKKKVLVFSTACSHPQNAGNRSRVYHLLSALEALGVDFRYFYLSGTFQALDVNIEAMRSRWKDQFFNPVYKEGYNGEQRLGADSSSIQKNWLLDDWFDDRLFSQLDILLDDFHPDAVFVDYAVASKTLSYFDSSVLKILNTNDVLSSRSEKLKLHNIPDGGWYGCSLEEEKIALSRADVVMSICEDDTVFFKSITQKPVVTIGHLIPALQNRKTPPNSNRILYLSSGGETNKASLEKFIDGIYPIMLSHLNNFKIVFAGKICNFIDKPPDNLEILGVVDNIRELYSNSDVAINCDIFGTGLSIKTITALAHGCPLVSTIQGARGLELNNQFMHIANSEDDFALAVSQICSDSSLANKMSQASLNFSHEYYQKQIFQLQMILDNEF